jgi:hypothetical protein
MHLSLPPLLKEDTKIAHTSTNECQSIKGGQTISFIFVANPQIS